MSESHLDSLNRYVSAVAITTRFHVSDRGTDIRTCSGVLVHPRVVLTAGHCVCHELQAGDKQQELLMKLLGLGATQSAALAIAVLGGPPKGRRLGSGGGRGGLS